MVILYSHEETYPCKKEGVRAVILVISGAIGAITNTTLVMGLIYILFKGAYAGLKGIPVTEVKSVILGSCSGKWNSGGNSCGNRNACGMYDYF